MNALDVHAAVLPMYPDSAQHGPPVGLFTADLTFAQLKCLQPSTELNDQVINVTLMMLQSLTTTVLVMSTHTWTMYKSNSASGSSVAKEKLQRAIRKHMKLYEVRTGCVPRVVSRTTRPDNHVLF